MKQKRYLYLILPIITLVLELLPYGAVCNFARLATDGSIGHFRELYSYFDLVPFGYANFAPLFTAICTCIILVLLFVYCITGKGYILSVAKGSLLFGVVLSLCPLLFGIQYYSVVGALISISLMIEWIIVRSKYAGNSNFK